MNVLFVCSRNQWRSPTAAQVFGRDPRMSVRAVGLSKASRRRLTAADAAWADVVLVMEPHHAQQLRSRLRAGGPLPPIHVLDVPDDYRYMDPELIELLRTATEAVLAGYEAGDERA